MHVFSASQLRCPGRLVMCAPPGVSVVCCVAAIGLWSSRSQEAPGPSTKHPNFWPQQLEEDGNLAEKVVSGPMHAGDGGRVSNPFEVAYSHPNDPPLNAHTLWTKWSHRIDSAFVTAADFGYVSFRNLSALDLWHSSSDFLYGTGILRT